MSRSRSRSLPPAPEAGRPRMADIARMAGVSVATVSRALAGSPRVNEETKARIEAAVRDTGYVVNRMARGLRLQQARQVFVMVPNIANPFHASVLLGAEEAAVAAGFHVLIGNTAGDPARAEEHARQLLTGAVDGMLVLGGHMPETLKTPSLRQRLVAVIEPVAAPGVPAVQIDNRAGGQAATRHLIELGHRRIGHIGGSAPATATPKRFEGYAAALAEAGIALRPELVRYGTFSIATGAEEMAELLALPEPPTAVFCGSDEIAMGAIRTIKQAGLRVPEDISIVGFDNIYFAAVYDPPLTTIDQPARRLGFEAMRLLADRLAGIAASKRGVSVPHRLIVRASTAPPRH
ncbi:LacI family DNA-binding transcriptional regulator [Inquilinus limosus]|uniref:LacI family DNA-binding transcriptional regulator n=1 Tax=Inquilinus limosus TaxID=171674 RepID=UPI00040B5E13|nr:LacI family DNA-binding transcriptional regulator [Inquilinus limosus]